MVKDKWWRHLVKTGTWRVVALLFITCLAYVFTGSFAVAGAVATIDLVIKSTLYFVHEWAWSKVSIGKELINKPGCVVWLTGLSGSGKTTIADRVAEKLRNRLVPVSRIDGDVARRTFSSDLGFSSEDRAENCKRAAHAAAYAKESSIVLASFISPLKTMRDYVRTLLGNKDVLIVSVVASVEECKIRDPKGMYAQLEHGCFKGSPFTGCHLNAPYEPELKPDIALLTQYCSIDECADQIIAVLEDKGYL